MATNTVQMILTLLNPAEKRRIVVLASAIFGVSLLDVAGVASIMPFMSVLAAPEMLEKSSLVTELRGLLGLATQAQLLLAMGSAVLVLLVVGNVAKAGVAYMQLAFCEGTSHALARRLLGSYLAQPYTFFLSRNTATLGANILAETGAVTNGILRPAMDVAAKSLISLMLIALLLAVDPTLSLLVAGSLSLVYGSLYIAVRRRLARRGQERMDSNELRYRHAAEALQGIKEIKALGREDVFLRRFSQHSRIFAELQTRYQVISLIPAYALEVIAFGGVLVMVLVALSRGQSLIRLLPVLALFAFAAKRLLPSFQEIFASLANIRYNTAALKALSRDMAEVGAGPGREAAFSAGSEVAPLPMRQALELRDISYSYPDTQAPVLQNLSLTVPALAQVAFVGSTGSGKSTIADLLMGLLPPQGGSILVDGRPLDPAEMPRWRRNLGYVSQQIYLSDDTLANNIAFGSPQADIDPAAMERAAKAAQLHGFIMAEMPQGYATPIGERGVRLSGGQRQRIGIARALYHDPGVLILDEATSSLDTLTEQSVMEAIRALGHQKTVLIIAHRLSTVKHCDKIFVLERGNIVAQGGYEELLAQSETFRRMVQADAQGGRQAVEETA